MKFLGVDYGAKRIGVALSNEEGTIAFPRAVMINDEKLISTLKSLVDEEHIQHIVVGDTRSHGGAPNPITKEAEVFVDELQRTTGLPVSRQFEAWSSMEASLSSEGGKKRDESAAAIILQRFLDSSAAQ